MSLFGTNTGFGAGGTGVFGNTTTDSHNPMKVGLDLDLRQLTDGFITPLFACNLGIIIACGNSKENSSLSTVSKVTSFLSVNMRSVLFVIVN